MLEVSGLSKSFGGLLALDSVDLKVGKGALFGILGPNGSGKTTLFNMLTGFLEPSAGQIRFEGSDLVGRSPELTTASTDANAALGLGVPAIAIGGGGHGGDVHSSREWFDNASSTAGVERALTIVATLARLA